VKKIPSICSEQDAQYFFTVIESPRGAKKSHRNETGEIATSLCSSQRQFYLNKGRRVATFPLVARNDKVTAFNVFVLERREE